MGKSIEEKRAAGEHGHEVWHGGQRDFHQREAEKYAAKAAEHEAKGKTKAAERARKVAERNARKAAEHQAKLDAGYEGYQTAMADQLADVEAGTGKAASRADYRRAFRETRRTK